MVLRKQASSKHVIIGFAGSGKDMRFLIEAEQIRKRTQLKNAEQPFNHFTEHSEEHLDKTTEVQKCSD